MATSHAPKGEDPDDQVRRQLGDVLCALLKGWTLGEIEERTGVHRARISRLRSGERAEFSIAALLRLVSSLGYDFTLNVTPRPPATVIPSRPQATVVRLDQFGRAVRN